MGRGFSAGEADQLRRAMAGGRGRAGHFEERLIAAAGAGNFHEFARQI